VARRQRGRLPVAKRTDSETGFLRWQPTEDGTWISNGSPIPDRNPRPKTRQTGLPWRCKMVTSALWRQTLRNSPECPARSNGIGQGIVAELIVRATTDARSTPQAFDPIAWGRRAVAHPRLDCRFFYAESVAQLLADCGTLSAYVNPHFAFLGWRFAYPRLLDQTPPA
jgi:hypothetical protein